MTVLRFSLVRLLFLALIVPVGVPERVTAQSPVQLIGEAETIFDWASQRCEKWHIPDTPARAWRQPDGEVFLVAGAEDSRLLHGEDLASLSVACEIALRGDNNPDPAARQDRWWIASVYPRANGTIEALVHAEYHGHQHPGQCDSHVYLTCWRNAILQAESVNVGQSFWVDTNTPIAMLPYPYDPAQQGRSGYFSPSNIIEKDGFLYVFVYAAPYRAQRRGVCLLRRPIDGSAADWRAWDGESFSVRFVDPYKVPIVRPDDHVCAPLSGIRGNLTSVVERDGSYLAVSPMGMKKANGATRVDGFWTLTSTNLIDWSAPKLLLELPLLWRRDCETTYTYAYPAFLDPNSPSSLFQTVGETFWLTYVRMRLDANCRASPERDLIKRQVVWPMGK